MRVLIVSLRGPTNANRRGGSQDYVCKIAAPWVRAGHEVAIVCGQEAVEGRLLPFQECVDQVRILRYGSPATRISSLLRATSKMAGSYDVLIENIMGLPLLLPWWLSRHVRLLAIKHHIEGAVFFRTLGMLRGAVGWCLESVVQPLAYRNTQLITVSEMTRQALSTTWIRPRKPVAIVPPGFDLAPLRAAEERAAAPTVVYIGALDLGRKRVDHLIDAFRRVVRALPEAQLVIGGSGPDESKLRALAAGAPVSFRGFLSETEKRRLLANAWVFCSPSLTEGFGISWVEANACGLPVVAYELGLDTVTPQCSVMVSLRDVRGLAEALVDLLRDPARRAAMGEAAVRNSHRFDWCISSDRFFALLSAPIHIGNESELRETDDLRR
jgi:glycosyltransferase involved in cell wall biosynthesis